MRELTDAQLEARVAKVNRRDYRHDMQKKIYRILESTTRWGKMATVGSLKRGAKTLAMRLSSAKRREEMGAA